MKINLISCLKVWTLLWVLMASACSSSSNDPTGEQPYLTLKNVSPKTVPAQGGRVVISVASHTPATASSSASWLSLKSSAPLGEHTSFTFQAEANKNEERTCTITIQAGDLKEIVTITQEKNKGTAEEHLDENLPAVQMAKKLGLGWNLGNQLDAHDKEIANETVWGNKPATKSLFESLVRNGFKTVRIPVTWLGKVGQAPEYTIDSAWMNRVQELVSEAEAVGLNVVINIHHDGFGKDHWLNILKASKDAAANEKIKEQIRAMWTQIAQAFKDKGEFLIFEGFNELQDGNWGYGENIKDGGKQYAILNEWQQLFVDAVRSTGGNNTTRYLGISGYSTNPDLTMKHLKLPTDVVDNKLLVSVHYYDPATFALEDKYSEWGHTGNVAKKEKWGDENHLRNIFAALKKTYVEKGIPVYIGEMGCVHRSNARSEAFRKYYLEYVCKAARTYGMAAFYWDNGNKGSGRECSGLLDHANGEYYNNGKEVIEVMKRGYYTDDSSYTLETVYQKAP